MANAAKNERRGAARFGRLASRLLFVLGGAAVGSAAVWLVSGASASADVVPSAPVVSTPGTNVTPVTDVARGTSTLTSDVAGVGSAAMCAVSHHHQEATTWSVPGETEFEVSERVSDAVTDFADNAMINPAKRTLGAFEHIVRKPEDTRQVLNETFAPSPDFGRKVWEFLGPKGHGDLVPDLVAGLPVKPESPRETGGAGEQVTDFAQPAAAQLPASGQTVLPMPGVGQQHGATGHDTDVPSHDGHRGDFPLSPAQLPVAPSIPTVPGGGTAPGGHIDGFPHGVPAWVASAVERSLVGTTLAGTRYMPLTPGSQPGVTPD